jgi:hypothetical protein
MFSVKMVKGKDWPEHTSLILSLENWKDWRIEVTDDEELL